MSYSISLLTNVSDCDTLLKLANNEKSDLVFRKDNMELQNKQHETDSTDLESDLLGVAAELTAFEAMVNALPDGRIKDENIAKIKRLQYKQFILSKRKEKSGIVAFLEKENDLQRIVKEIEEVDVYIAAITERKMAI